MNLPKPTDLSNTILVTHQNCMDGSGCTILYRRAGGKQENVRYISAGSMERFINDELDKLGDKFVIFADVGLSTGPHLERYADRLEKRGQCVVLDHHKTSLGLAKRTWCDVRQDICGTELMRQYLVSNNFGGRALRDKRLSAIIQDHDLWLQKDPRSKDLASYCVFLGQDVFVENFMDRPCSGIIFTPAEIIMMDALIKRRDKTIEFLMKHVIIKDIRLAQGSSSFAELVKIGYLISSEPNVSLLLDTVFMRHPSVQVACQVNFDRGSVSFRSRGIVDVSELAMQFGGGGHRLAAGHKIPSSIVKSILEELHGQ